MRGRADALPRPIWAADPTTFQAAPHHWLLAGSIFYAINNLSAWDLVPIGSPQTATTILSHAWGIRSRTELLLQLYSLLAQGHRQDFGEMVEWGSALAPRDLRRTVKDLGRRRDEDARETAWRLEQVGADTHGIRAVDFTAWDHVRFLMLCRAGVAAGLLSADEAVDTMVMVWPDLRTRYTSFVDMGEHFARSRWFWNGEGGRAGERLLAESRGVLGVAADGVRSPWAVVPWDTPPLPSRYWLVDALWREGLLEPLSAPARAASGPWALHLDEVLRDRLGPSAGPDMQQPPGGGD